MTATDPRLAPLAAALHTAFCPENSKHPIPSPHRMCDYGPDILAALPDGWCGHATGHDCATVEDAMQEAAGFANETAAKNDDLAATIATLRATLDGLVEEVPEAELAARFGHGDRYPLDGEVEIEGRIYALRAALATAKEAGG
jgi:hypothetical protein